MLREQYINEKIDKLTQFWSNLAAFFGGFFFAGLAILDYIATPENFLEFLKYRLLGVFLFAIIFILNRKKASKRYQLTLIYFGVIVSASIIEYMIINFGGHASTYYAGLFILVMVIVGFIPVTLFHSVFLSILALLIYIIPIIIFDKSLNFRTFSAPLSFLITTFSIANVWRYLSQQRLKSEIGHLFDIEKQKGQI